MKKTRPIAFAELRQLLRDLGFAEKPTEAAYVFDHAKEGLLVFRRYGDMEPIDEGDVISTRKFLDLRGVLEAAEFDALLQQTTAPA